MTKLEELSALLVNELHEFNKNIEKLESISQQLIDLKVKMDVSEYKALVDDHQKEMAMHKNMIESFENRFNAKIDQAKIYPTWAVVVFIIAVLYTLGSILRSFVL
ncbi:hypothetical protein EV196_105267 [Mariniflexile fucanivorans]|uniref:Uncharacterized protein n=1 Tax=Mariniflexile fucanivorans TaxID=264023 RepID=A0A4R1RHR9_9FLAO|nr:DUF6730 family protein [Mariniflexile fucanivorans]TCL65604.1 hypothetical protein EV196_105267 [Mariniflexile fucanivorans]